MKKIDRLYSKVTKHAESIESVEFFNIAIKVVPAYFDIWQDYGDEMPGFKDNEEWYKRVLQLKDYGASFEDFKAYYSAELSPLAKSAALELDKYFGGD